MPVNDPYPGNSDQKMSIFTSIWIERTLTRCCRSISELFRYYFMWATFSLCFRFISLIFFHLLCSKNLDKLYLFILIWLEIMLSGISWPLRTQQHCGNFSFCFRFLALMVSEICRSQSWFIEKLLENLMISRNSKKCASFGFCFKLTTHIVVETYKAYENQNVGPIRFGLALLGPIQAGRVKFSEISTISIQKKNFVRFARS